MGIPTVLVGLSWLCTSKSASSYLLMGQLEDVEKESLRCLLSVLADQNRSSSSSTASDKYGKEFAEEHEGEEEEVNVGTNEWAVIGGVVEGVVPQTVSRSITDRTIILVAILSSVAFWV